MVKTSGQLRAFFRTFFFVSLGGVLVTAFVNCSSGFKTIDGSNQTFNSESGTPYTPGASPTPSNATPTPTPTPTSVGTAKENDVVDSALNVVESAYKAMAAQLSSDKGMAYRYGPDANFYATTGNSGLPTYPKRANQSLLPLSDRLGFSNRACVTWCGNWQIGGPLSADPGDYSSSILNFSYLPDEPAKYPGAGTVQQISMAHETYALEPEPSWTTYNGENNNGADNDANIEEYKKRGLAMEKPTALGKCYGRGGWCTNSLTAFANGVIIATGGNTAHNFASTQLAAGKIPTAIAITNSGEFALVTVWDVNNLKGQVAVIALGGMCQWCNPNDESTWGANWGDWMRMYMGLPNLGNWGGMKVLGYVDLPASMKAPTEISVSTGVRANEYEVVTRMSDTDLMKASERARYYNGDLKEAIARTGMAVVLSKSEQRIAFIDLRPLFSYYREQYFNQSQTVFEGMIANRGQAANQWPYSFTQVPAQMPVVVKVVDSTNKPTSVKLKLSLPARAFIATQEGKLHIFDLGPNYLNKAGTSGVPADIKEVGSVTVGRNPTSVTYAREHGWADKAVAYPQGVDQEMIVNSRGDRKVEWVRFNSDFTSGSVVRTLQDSRMMDPIAIEDAANHGTESYVLSVIDFTGRKVHNYMYGPVIFWTQRGNVCQPPNGCQPLNNAPFEYGGAYSVKGKPFHAGGANIN